MKSIIKIIAIFTIIIFQFSGANAQISINEDGSNPDASAILDVSSTNKGILIPRMTTAERTAINNPATGLLVFDTDENSFWYYSNSTWTVIGAGAFTSENGLTYSNDNDDDFVLGADSLNFGSGAEIKLFFDKSKGAFRTGKVSGTLWDESNVGDYSTAFGIDTEASGNVTLAFGADTKANGFAATAFGYASTASGYASTAFGAETTAPSYAETVFGVHNTNYMVNNTFGFDSNDRLFVIGNGTSDYNRSDAMIIYKSGNAEINGDLTVSGSITGTNTAFLSENGLTYSNNNSDDFVFGADSINHGSGAEYKLIFKRDNGAFRVGTMSYDYWDTDSLAWASFAGGHNTRATGDNSFAYGTFANASGNGAVAIGDNNTASGNVATAFGANTTASGNYTLVSGFYTTASGSYSNSLGYYSEASGDYSNAFGRSTAEGSYSNAFGRSTTAAGNYSNAFGRSSTANADYSTAIGYSTNAYSYGETALGLYNTIYTAIDTNSFNTEDRIFVIGNGTGNVARSDAMIVYKSGNTEINGALTINNEYTLPTTDGTANQILTTDGNGALNWADNSNIFSSNNNVISTHYNYYGDDFIIGSADTLNYGTGTETKLFFDNDKGAFRVGAVTGTNWNESNLGNYSIAFGQNTTASATSTTAFGKSTTASATAAVAFGQNSIASASTATAFGYGTEASGNSAVAFGSETTASGIMSAAFGDNSTASGLTSIAFGDNTTASGDGSTSFGFFGNASGDISTVFGFYTTASGNYSTAFGYRTTSFSYGETALGMYNTTYTPNSTSSYDSDDRLFVIGNGTGTSARSDAMIVYKNGNTELNGKLIISDTTTINKPLIVNDLVGIGTTPTNADLEVAYSGNGDYFSLSSIGYLNTGGSGTGTYTGRFAIYADGRISGTAFIAHSDKRIKNIIGKTNNENDLAILNNIEITNYTMKDNIRYGDKMVKKVIAQQVAEVYPQAVTTNTTEIVPDIYQQATMDENGWVSFSTSNFRLPISDLKTGDKVQIIFKQGKELLEILEIKENAFRVKPITNYESPITIFIYGRQVQDFHTVDYEAISMLNVSATQQLAKEVEQLKKENEQLKMQLQKINELEAQLEQIQAQLNNQ